MTDVFKLLDTLFLYLSIGISYRDLGQNFSCANNVDSKNCGNNKNTHRCVQKYI